MSDPAVEALRRLCDLHGRKGVADAIGANEQTLYQILTARQLASGRARGVGRGIRERLDRAFPGWLTEVLVLAETTPEPWGPVSRQTRHPSHSFDAPLVSYGSIMKQGITGQYFRTLIEDDAGAPELPRGAEVLWDTQRPARPGRFVLVQDSHGHTHVRQYRQGRAPERWIAAAINPAYASLDSMEDGLRVLAVKKAVMDPDD